MLLAPRYGVVFTLHWTEIPQRQYTDGVLASNRELLTISVRETVQARLPLPCRCFRQPRCAPFHSLLVGPAQMTRRRGVTLCTMEGATPHQKQLLVFVSTHISCCRR